MENKFFYNQKVFYAEKFEEIKFFPVTEMSTIESSSLRLTNPNLGVGVLYSLKTSEFSFIKFNKNYNIWDIKTWFIAISLDENEVLKILAENIISEQKKEIDNLKIKIANCWDLISKAQKYL